MRKFRINKSVANACHIYKMLKSHARGKHLSFHTPGHKVGKWDVTELAYTDNLASPNACILQAETDVAKILGAEKSFILTDGSTSGVFSMLYASKKLGAKRILAQSNSHKSVFNACAVLNLDLALFDGEDFAEQMQKADALLLTSPDYYGNIPSLCEIAKRCKADNKLLLIDGAHGGHLHFDKSLHAGAYADLWVDGVHKSLPAFTQGAVVSAKTQAGANALYEGVQIFRTTSPSYPIMASVEYAVKYPRNIKLEERVRAFAQTQPSRVQVNADYTKLCVRFGKSAFQAEKELQNLGIYAEFCDGDWVVFYLSPATKISELRALTKRLLVWFKKYPYLPQKPLEQIHTPLVFPKNTQTEWVQTENCAGRICAGDCGLFPPCTPLIRKNERIENDKIALIKQANNVYGVWENKILVYKEDEDAR